MHRSPTHRKIFVIILGVSLAGALVLLGVLFDWRLTTHAPPTPGEITKTSDTSSPVNYDGLDEKAVAKSLKSDTGLDLEQLKHDDVNSLSFTSESQAEAAAAALTAVGQPQKALAVYQRIETLYPDVPKSALFYDNAAVAADASGDITLGTNYLKKERQQIEHDASLDSNARKSELEKIDSKLALRGADT